MINLDELQLAHDEDGAQKVLGTGTFGVVVEGRYRGTSVAIKRVLPKQSSHTNSVIVSGGMSVPLPPTIERKLETLRAESLTGSLSGGPPPDMSPDMSLRNKKPNMLSARGISNLLASMPVRMELSQLIAEFKVEMRTLGKLRHPNITTVMGAVVSNVCEPMLVMELMHHGSLSDLMKNETFALESDLLLPILHDIIQGVRFLHAASPPIIHGDLKAANVLVDKNFRAKVSDFGLSQKRRLGLAFGTPQFMSPELLQEGQQKVESDVYAFGILLYEVFSRRTPYEGENLEEVLREVADTRRSEEKRPPIPQGCHPGFAILMKSCWNKDPKLRPRMDEIGEAISHFDMGESVSSQWGGMTLHKMRRNRQTEDVLYDVFPKHIADALVAGQKVEPEHRDCVTIFFSDIVGYTELSSTMEASKVMDLLDRLYSQFDVLTAELGVFKVETVGDAYVATTNLVQNQEHDHVQRMARFALGAVHAAGDTLIDLEDPSKGFVKIRVGINAGAVTASVVGRRNKKYCLFGDSVNVAARMETNSVEGCIHASSSAAMLLRDQDPSIPVILRGEIEVKGKGRMVTYWIDHPPPDHLLPPPERRSEHMDGPMYGALPFSSRMFGRSQSAGTRREDSYSSSFKTRKRRKSVASLMFPAPVVEDHELQQLQQPQLQQHPRAQLQQHHRKGGWAQMVTSRLGIILRPAQQSPNKDPAAEHRSHTLVSLLQRRRGSHGNGITIMQTPDVRPSTRHSHDGTSRSSSTGEETRSNGTTHVSCDADKHKHTTKHSTRARRNSSPPRYMPFGSPFEQDMAGAGVRPHPSEPGVDMASLSGANTAQLLGGVSARGDIGLNMRRKSCLLEPPVLSSAELSMHVHVDSDVDQLSAPRAHVTYADQSDVHITCV